jgi:hypothetical protein
MRSQGISDGEVNDGAIWSLFAHFASLVYTIEDSVEIVLNFIIRIAIRNKNRCRVGFVNEVIDKHYLERIRRGV